MNDDHDAARLAAHAIGLLDANEARSVEEHLARCQRCRDELAELRALDQALKEIPAEALLEGPPTNGDLLVQRALRQVRRESAAPRGFKQIALVAAAVAAVAAAGIGGLLIGREWAPQTAATATATSTPAPGSYTLAATDPATGSAMTVTVTPAAGWVRLSATVKGISAGERCRLVAVSRGGTTQVAGSWLVSPAGEKDGTTLTGAALVAPNDLAAVRVENFDGRKFVTVSI